MTVPLIFPERALDNQRELQPGKKQQESRFLIFSVNVYVTYIPMVQVFNDSGTCTYYFLRFQTGDCCLHLSWLRSLHL